MPEQEAPPVVEQAIPLLGALICRTLEGDNIDGSVLTFEVEANATEWEVPDSYIFPAGAAAIYVEVQLRQPILLTLPLDPEEQAALRPMILTLRP